MANFPLLNLVVAAMSASLAACGSTPPDFIECRDDTSCDRFADGECLVNPATGNQFCTYPDAECETGMRWSDHDVEESISGACVAARPIDAGIDGEVDAGGAIDAAMIDATALPAGMVLVDEGTFSMGCNVVAGCGPYPSMVPYREIQISEFAVDRLEASVAEYFDCIDAGVCTIQPTGIVDPTSQLPVRVTWQAAVTYCAWRGRRLATEAEWEKAARSYDGRQYPWGDVPPVCALVQYSGCSPNQLIAVDSLPDGASIYGAQNMAGNMWEWTADWYAADYYSTSPASDPQGPATGTKRSVRGGDYLDGAPQLRTWYRREFDPGSGAGIRCAVSL